MTSINQDFGLPLQVAFFAIVGGTLFVLSQFSQERMERIVSSCLNPLFPHLFREDLSCKIVDLTNDSRVQGIAQKSGLLKTKKLIEAIQWFSLPSGRGECGFRDVEGRGDCFFLCYIVCFLEKIQQDQTLLENWFLPFMGGIALENVLLRSRAVSIVTKASKSTQEELETLFADDLAMMHLVRFFREITALAIEQEPEVDLSVEFPNDLGISRAIVADKQTIYAGVERSFPQNDHLPFQEKFARFIKEVRSGEWANDHLIQALFRKTGFSLRIIDRNLSHSSNEEYSKGVQLCTELDPQGVLVLDKERHYRVMYQKTKEGNLL